MVMVTTGNLLPTGAIIDCQSKPANPPKTLQPRCEVPAPRPAPHPRPRPSRAGGPAGAAGRQLRGDRGGEVSPGGARGQGPGDVRGHLAVLPRAQGPARRERREKDWERGMEK